MIIYSAKFCEMFSTHNGYDTRNTEGDNRPAVPLNRFKEEGHHNSQVYNKEKKEICRFSYIRV